MTNAEVRQAADKVLQQMGIVEPPVPVERIVRQLGAQLRYEPFEGELSGMFFRKNGEAIIGVNSLHPKVRQRFTIAHELGHLVLHDQDKFHVDRSFPVLLRDGASSRAVDQFEVAANGFAAELLMPLVMLQRDFRKEALDFADDEAARRLADRYNVSLQAMVIRLSYLIPGPKPHPRPA
jgi:Zn-dependent peptidase ImmA (M78 family)